MHRGIADALRLVSILGIVVPAGCTSRTSDLGHGGDQPAPVDAAAGRGGTSDSGAGPRGAGGHGAGGRATTSPNVSSGGATSSPPLKDASPAPAEDPRCQTLTCPTDGGCSHLDVRDATTCRVGDFSFTALESLSIGCGLVVTLTQAFVGAAGWPFEQAMYDLRTGELVGVRAMRADLSMSRPVVDFVCEGATPELRRQMGSAPWDGCTTAHRCIICTSPGTPTSDPPCTPDDLAQLANPMRPGG